jgi:transposase
MEACATSHHGDRMVLGLGHAVRLVPPVHVKPFVKREKNDAADATAIAEAASRPTLHFVAVRTEASRAQGMLFRAHVLLVGQRTQTINALRGHLAEFGVVPRGPSQRLPAALEDPASGLPEAVREFGHH